MPAEAIRINRRVLLQCSIGAPGLKQPFAQPQQNGALSAKLPDGQMETKVCFSPHLDRTQTFMSLAKSTVFGWQVLSICLSQSFKA